MCMTGDNSYHYVWYYISFNVVVNYNFGARERTWARQRAPRTLQASNKFDPERFSCELPQVVLTFRFKSCGHKTTKRP